nr:hypothetical protein BgiMline_022458 [Biomphalaria glabrata]
MKNKHRTSGKDKPRLPPMSEVSISATPEVTSLILEIGGSGEEKRYKIVEAEGQGCRRGNGSIDERYRRGGKKGGSDHEEESAG